MKSAYRASTKFFHPDLNGQNPISSLAFREVREAVELLRSNSYTTDIDIIPVILDAAAFVSGFFEVSYSENMPCGCRGGYSSATSVCPKCEGTGIKQTEKTSIVNIDECSFAQINDSIVAEHDFGFFLLSPDLNSILTLENHTLVLNTALSASQKDFEISDHIVYKPFSLDLGTRYDSMDTISSQLSDKRVFDFSMRLSIAI